MTEASCSTESILSKLKSPQLSDLARKRKLSTNPPPKGDPKYMAKAEDVALTISRTDWWSHHESELPNWSKACKMSLLFQSSSAAAERVFSLLQNSFNQQQYSSLENYIEASIMLQYNNRS